MGTNITGIGNANAIGFKSRVTGGAYFPPELKDALVGVWSAYGKSNDSTDRNIIKNKIKDRGGDFVISNAAFKLNSGFGKYEITFQYFPYRENVTNVSDSKVVFGIGGQLLIPYPAITENIPSFKIKVNGLSGTYHFRYYYRSSDGVQHSVDMAQDGYYELPICYNVQSSSDGTNCGFANNGTDVITITQIPSFEGAFVTDGIDDLIKSTKSATEMLDGSNEVTVVSMIHQIKTNDDTTRNNWFFTPVSYLENRVVKDKIGKTGIYGYTSTNVTNAQISDITPILGDKNDYTLYSKIEDGDRDYFTVEGFQNQGTRYVSSIAWYWTIIANKVLTTDQINQVIAYFNLDRTLKPDILCDVKKQGITNDNHAEFGDKLIDFSGNGKDIQLNNIAWKGDSGIGKYVEDFTTWYGATGVLQTFSKIEVTDGFKHNWVINRRSGESAINSFKVLIKGIPENGYIQYRYFESEDATKKSSIDIYEDGEYSLPNSTLNNLNDLVGFQLFAKIPPLDNQSFIGLTITQIPSHTGALCLDGVEDFGKVTGMPVYKDYTVVTDREIFANIGAISSKNNPGAFVETAGNSVYSFGQATSGLNFISTRSISYLSKYSYCGQSITAGAAEDGTDMWLGTIRDNDSRFFNGAIYSLMSFPYSMSEFLIERQLKKHKLGTLYPNMVEFRPVIKANANYKITYYQIDITNTWKSIKVGDYIVIGAKLAFQITFDNDASELKEVVSPQLSGIIVEKRPSNPGYNIYSYITSKSPQKINITIDEYIRFEDIVQPYPVLLRFNDENGNEVSWGGKFRVGSTITRIGSAADSNLLPNIYNIFGLLLNGNQVTSSKVIVEKTMVFKVKSAYIFDNNEPKCILSPRLLRIPNSSYKILGYIPDISGHGNHGKINNSAYAEGSGVNEDGSYQFDGVDDFVTIPTTVGGKQVLMKVNWDSPNASILYDQRGYNNEFAIYNSTNDSDSNPIPAYQGRNNGQTYIDGILNSNIKASELRAITHNITITNELSSGANKTYPIIGSSKSNAYFVNMALYDFMLFDNISTDDKIKELNEYVGIEAKVELPPYYWDTYGKTNSDADRDTIQQRGVAVGDYDLTNYNHAYEGMSGYNGYPVVFGAGKTLEVVASVYSYIFDVTSTTIHVTMVKNAGTGLLFSYVKKDGALTNIKEIPAFRVTVKGLEGNSKFGYRYLATEDATAETLVYLGNGTHELAKSFAPTEALLDLTRNAWVGIFITPMVEGEVVFDCDITIEVLPEYENGLVYDGITDYSKNANIPALDDFTAIIKREWLKKQGCPLIKGSKVYEGGNGNALLLEWDKAYNFVFYKRTDIMEGEVPDNISFITPTNYNGNVITRGSEQDTNGICIAGDGNAGFANMVFYKLILYPKTIPLLQINFLKNLMERDEIIDLNNPIFIKNE